MDGEVKQNVLGRCPEGKMQYTLQVVPYCCQVQSKLQSQFFGSVVPLAMFSSENQIEGFLKSLDPL